MIKVSTRESFLGQALHHHQVIVDINGVLYRTHMPSAEHARKEAARVVIALGLSDSTNVEDAPQILQRAVCDRCDGHGEYVHASSRYGCPARCDLCAGSGVVLR